MEETKENFFNLIKAELTEKFGLNIDDFKIFFDKELATYLTEKLAWRYKLLKREKEGEDIHFPTPMGRKEASYPAEKCH